MDHIAQAEKEAFAMWCHNALRRCYEPVWVVLTDLNKVGRGCWGAGAVLTALPRCVGLGTARLLPRDANTPWFGTHGL